MIENVNSIYGEVDGFPAAGRSTTAEIMVKWQVREIQAAMMIAKKYPRNEAESYGRIMRACQHRSLASSPCMSLKEETQR